MTESVQSGEKEAKYVGEGTDKTAVYNCLKGHYKQGKPKVFSAVNGKSKRELLETTAWKVRAGLSEGGATLKRVLRKAVISILRDFQES